MLGLTLYHFDGYGRALDALEDMGFRIDGGTLIAWPYDWRVDVRTSAQALHDRLEEPDLRGRRIGIVAHSMGGLIARHMLENLGAPAGVLVEQCVLVAVPHLGAPIALQNVLGLRPEIFLTGPQCRAALRNPAFPSGYQLLPHGGIPALLEASTATGFVINDLFSAAVAQRFSLINGSLAAAQQSALPFMGPGFKPPCRYIAIAGNAQKTTTANYLDGPASARAVEEATAGDGTVPLWSAAPPGIPVRYVAATHGGMFADSDTVAMLRAVLKPGQPGARLFNIDAAEGRAVLSAQAVDTSVEVGKPFTIAVVADRPTDKIDAALEIERIFEGDRTERQEVPVHYTGGFLRSIPMDFKAPEDRALIRVQVRQPGLQATGGDATILAIK